ncbi:patatin-like phospholipase family protein [Actinomadura scrupuli]|uniref:patatin-like phospholipase family protein n=1 Tax=Actinomadura scrupuli TaxID=559629 RepID=UPI003D9814A1
MAGRALVLGGGGVTGIAWEWGILTGLREAGVDLTTADLVVGTSAGAAVGAQVAAGVDPAERYAVQLAGAAGEIAARLRPLTIARLGWATLRSRGAQQAGAAFGRLALAAITVPEAERRAVIASRLPVQTWPEDRRLLLTAVDAATGEFTVFHSGSGVPLVEAVAASCAVPGVWPPVTIGGRRYIDGGMRSATNADLATGHDRVVVIAPITRGFGPIAGVASQVARLNGKATVVSPGQDARRAIGRNSLDPSRRAPAARAGHAQAAAVADQVAAVWSA